MGFRVPVLNLKEAFWLRLKKRILCSADIKNEWPHIVSFFFRRPGGISCCRVAGMTVEAFEGIFYFLTKK